MNKSNDIVSRERKVDDLPAPMFERGLGCSGAALVDSLVACSRAFFVGLGLFEEDRVREEAIVDSVVPTCSSWLRLRGRTPISTSTNAVAALADEPIGEDMVPMTAPELMRSYGVLE